MFNIIKSPLIQVIKGKPNEQHSEKQEKINCCETWNSEVMLSTISSNKFPCLPRLSFPI